MELLIADTPVEFYIEKQLKLQIGLGTLPFSNMNKTGSGVCNFFAKGSCPFNNICPLRHIKGDKTIVCKHWLRGLCKKGDDCEFLHEFDMSKMPECYFFSRFGECMNKECPFLHIDPNSKIHDCAWYNRGFCRNGPKCKNRHVRRVACKNYLNGFCPDGKACLKAHPRFLPIPGSDQDPTQKRWICHYCNEKGHKIQFCHKLPMEERRKYMEMNRMNFNHNNNANNNNNAGHDNHPSGISAAIHFNQSNSFNAGSLGNPEMGDVVSNPIPNGQTPYNDGKNRILSIGISGAPIQRQPVQARSLDEVTCFKCGEKGHYANRCTKGYLAFLSKNNPGNNQPMQPDNSMKQ